MRIIACSQAPGFPDFWKVEEKLDRLISKLKKKPEVIVLGYDPTIEHWAGRQRLAVTKLPSGHDYEGRNRKACLRADVLCVFWDGKSPAYRDLIKLGKHHSLEVRSFVFEPPAKEKAWRSKKGGTMIPQDQPVNIAIAMGLIEP